MWGLPRGTGMPVGPSLIARQMKQCTMLRQKAQAQACQPGRGAPTGQELSSNTLVHTPSTTTCTNSHPWPGLAWPDLSGVDSVFRHAPPCTPHPCIPGLAPASLPASPPTCIIPGSPYRPASVCLLLNAMAASIHASIGGGACGSGGALKQTN